MTTTDHVTDHVTDHACEVSLIEQLKSVPLNSREWIKDEKGSGLTNITYGRYCQEAAEALQKAKAEVERLKDELNAWDYGTRAKREQERAENAEAEVERLKVINADMRNFLSKAIHNEGFNEEQALKFIYQ